MPIFIKNIINTVIIYLCLCIVLLPLNLLWEGYIWHDSQWERWMLKDIIIQWFSIGIHTTISLFLFLFLGRKFLIKTNNTFLNIISVLTISAIVAIIIIIIYKEANSNRWGGLFVVPIYPISETISYFFKIGEKYGYLSMSVLPSLAMWIGMITKRLP